MGDFRLPTRNEKVTPLDTHQMYINDPNDSTDDPSGSGFFITRANFLGAQFTKLFTALLDTPSTFVGQEGKTVKVNAAANALVFDFATFLDLNDVTETTFTTKQGQVVTVNSGATGLEFTVNSFLNLDDVSETSMAGDEGKVVVVDVDLTTEPATYSLKFDTRPTFGDLYAGNAILEGGLVYRNTLLDYIIWSNSYIINGRKINRSVSGQVTNDNGGALPRKDVYFIEVDASLNPSVGILKGLENANPVEPTLDLLTQVKVSVREIAAGQTVDPDAITEVIYDEYAQEPTEWDVTDIPAGANMESLVAPKVGTKSILLAAYVTADILEFQKLTKITYVSSESQVFYIKNPTSFEAQATIELKLINSATTDYWVVTLTPALLSSYGFVVGNTDWQLIQIPLLDLTASSRTATQYDTLQMTFTRTPILGLDWIVVQGSVPNPSTIVKGKFVDGDNPLDAVYMDGKVGVGIAAPVRKLDVYEPSTAVASFGLGNTESQFTILQGLSECAMGSSSDDFLIVTGVGATANFLRITRALTQIPYGTFRAPVLRTAAYTVSTLPTGTNGDRIFITDSNATYASLGVGVTATGGGSNDVPMIFLDGAWVTG
jgi:hypothetical protein